MLSSSMILQSHVKNFLNLKDNFISGALARDKSRILCDIARNRGHFAPVINCQRNLISKMADKNDRSQGKRIPCGFFK